VSAWRRLSAELDRWQGDGRTATLWWRDDDAVAPTTALERLLDTHRRCGVPLGLASIPAHAEDGLAAALEPYPSIAVLQHGYAHENHANEGDRAVELGGNRQRPRVVEELRRGWNRLRALFPVRLLPVMVPPWNRISPQLFPDLHALGFRALSCFAPRTRREAVAGLTQANCHVDIVDWRGGRCFRGEARCLDQLCGHLEARRSGSVDADEATGVLSHHLVHDDGCWDFLEALFERCNRHPATRWLDPGEACLEQ